MVKADGVTLGTRFLDEIESAAHFVVCEGLANTLKRASAQHAPAEVTAGLDHVGVDGEIPDVDMVMQGLDRTV